MDNRCSVECNECGRTCTISERYFHEKIIKRGFYRCRSCAMKGTNNPNYGKYKLIHSRDKVQLECNNCNTKFTMTYKRAWMRKTKYGVDLCKSCSRKGERNPFFGLRFTEDKKGELGRLRKDYYEDSELGEQRREMQRQRFTGEKNPMWKGSVERSDYTWRNKTWRMKILNMFNFTCDRCMKTFPEDKLIAHHLNGANWDIENRLNPDNGVCLCESCHKAFHNMYGYGDNTKEQYYEFVIKEGSETTESIFIIYEKQVG